jgi:hypothetical protein
MNVIAALESRSMHTGIERVCGWKYEERKHEGCGWGKDGHHHEHKHKHGKESGCGYAEDSEEMVAE